MAHRARARGRSGAPADADRRPHPGLTGAIRANTRATENAIAQALTDTGADPTVAQIAAAATLAALMESLTAWAVTDDPGPLDDAIRLALDVLDRTVTR